MTGLAVLSVLNLILVLVGFEADLHDSKGLQTATAGSLILTGVVGGYLISSGVHIPVLIALVNVLSVAIFIFNLTIRDFFSTTKPL